MPGGRSSSLLESFPPTLSLSDDDDEDFDDKSTGWLLLFDSDELFGFEWLFDVAVVGVGVVFGGGVIVVADVVKFALSARFLRCCWWCWNSCCWWWMEAARSKSGFECPKFGCKILSMENGRNCLCNCWMGLLTAWRKFCCCCCRLGVDVEFGKNGWKRDGLDNVSGEFARVEELDTFELGDAGGVEADL